MIRRGFLGSFFVFLFVPLVQSAEPPKHFEVTSIKDLAYMSGPDADPEKNKLDLYLPKGLKDFPIVVFVHGGGYQKGDRKEGESVGKTIAARGVGVAMISYRLYPKAKHPAQIQDVASAFAWVKQNARKYQGSGEVFVSGHSAGAHLASLLATDSKYLQKESLKLNDIAGVVAISGGYRILPIRKDVFGDEATLTDASPFAHLKGGHPPFLIIYGDGDTPERHALSREFRDSLKKAGTEVELLEVKERTHQELFSKMGDGDPTTEAALLFVGKHSKTQSKNR